MHNLELFHLLKGTIFFSISGIQNDVWIVILPLVMSLKTKYCNAWLLIDCNWTLDTISKAFPDVGKWISKRFHCISGLSTLMLLACHKKSYLICVELTNFLIFTQPIPIFFKVLDSQNRAETAAWKNFYIIFRKFEILSHIKKLFLWHASNIKWQKTRSSTDFYFVFSFNPGQEKL